MRPNKKEYYLKIAEDVARRGTCLRRNYGAVIVKDDSIVSCGYNGASRGEPNCCDIGKCERQELNIPHGERYELCRGVHAECNAIINAARAGVSVLGGTIYIAQSLTDDPILARDCEPCEMCKRILKNAGIKEIII